MRLVSYNVRFGGGSRVAFLGAVLAHLEPDVVLLQEATDPVAVDRIAHAAGLGHVYRRPGWSVATLSREPLLGHEWHRPGRSRGFVEVVPAGAPRIRLVGLHLPAGLSARGERARLRSVDTLLEWAGGAADDNTILMGDLNSVARGDAPSVRAMPLWLRLLLRFDGGIRTDVQDRLAAAGWVDAFRHLHPTDAGFTLPALAPQVRLDYALVPPGLLPAVTVCAPALDAPMVARASDHLPLVTVIED
ncbi:MAG TPA: endonuclease/exonuclease/phosphatase family protein [Candidatus Limnocylindrales bacterium]|nr:endonuclease/exonuclease/phosphatase family protein [Candidatus Limnocylindrales bacterium]